jgi:peptidoglycan hydrolase-like protein with peptidoglycan-binding domain
MRTLLAALTALMLLATSLHAAGVNPRVQELQEGLIELGYDVGKPDGILGPSTRDAIRAIPRCSLPPG